MVNQKFWSVAGQSLSRHVICATVALSIGLLPPSLSADHALAGPDGVVRVEVSQNASLFAFDEAPVFDDGLPAYGNPFVIQGVIYPAGTLASSVNQGMNSDGTPEFPDRVIGEWTCWGRFIGDGIQTTGGPWVMSTQVFSFGENSGYGGTTIVTTGYETVDATVDRAVTGGTGDFVDAAGVQRQQIIGHNASGGLALGEEITLDDTLRRSLSKIEQLLARIATRLGLVPHP